MLLALALDVLLLASIAGGLVWLALAGRWYVSAGVVVVVLVGLFSATKQAIRTWTLDITLEPQHRLEATVQRLCLLADMPEPVCYADRQDVPLSFTIARPGRRPRLYVTTGMMRMLDARELDAVVGHELSHIANRDAVLMTMLAGPGALMKAGVRSLWAAQRRRQDGGNLMLAAIASTVVMLPLAALLNVVSRLVSRDREFSADYGAALLCGSPAAVANMLEHVSPVLGRADLPDLRAIAARDEFHILPVGPEPRGWRRLYATHPKLARRLAQLRALERDLQHARLRAGDGD
jgi:heat shock protein HtpX